MLMLHVAKILIALIHFNFNIILFPDQNDFFRDNKTIEPWTFYFMLLVVWLYYSKIRKIVAKGTEVFLNAN